MSPPAPDIHRNLATIRERIRTAAAAAGRRPEDIRLIAVSNGSTEFDFTKLIIVITFTVG